MGKSKIEWTEKTWNPVLGCSKVSEGCRNCYAMSMSARIANSARDREDPTPIQQGYMKVVPQDEDGKYLPKWNNNIALVPERLEDPLRWQKPAMVFVNSMSDLFHPDVPFPFVAAVFGVMAYSRDHTFQVLTKRPERMAEFFEWIRKGEMKIKDGKRLDYDEPQKCIQFAISKIQHQDTLLMGMTNVKGRKWPLPNVWLGTSVENQETADERIPHLLKCPAAVRFLSCEPLLGPVDITQKGTKEAYTFATDTCPITGSPIEHFEPGPKYIGIDWVIAGGESGHNARPMHPDWVRSLRDQCQKADVSFFFKQWGAWKPNYGHNNSYAHKWKDGNYAHKVGKKLAGRGLDGQEWNQMPNPE